jgi:hypothetical protein
VYQYLPFFTEADPLADKTPILQQPVISIRISDELRQRLETLKEIMAAKSGEPVSTSEAAKQLLESSKEERLEFVNLLSEPIDSLVKIRGKVDAKLPLSQAEWTLVAYYCQQGAELFANTGQTEISFESLAGILEAFLAVYGLVSKQRKRSPMAPYLLTNLPSERQTEAKPSEEIAKDDVQRAVNRTIHIEKDGRLHLKMDGGRAVELDPRKHLHLDHGYAMTSYSSQGQTADRVLIHVDTELGAKDLLNSRMAYVSVSRGRYDAQIYTNNAQTLGRELSRDVSHSPAIQQEPGAHKIEPQTARTNQISQGFGLGL